MDIQWTYLIHDQWRLVIGATERGLCFVGSQGRDVNELEDWARRRFISYRLLQHEESLRPYVRELKEYFQGKRTSFSVPLDLQGTPFQLAVWKAMSEIPFGHTNSYQEVADQIGKPSSVRAVGSAIGKNPVLIIAPCHRVIGKSGRLTGYRGGLKMKEALLQLEGAGSDMGNIRH